MDINYKLTESDMREVQNELLTPINDNAIIRLITWSDQGIIFIVLLLWGFFGKLMLQPFYWVAVYLFLNLLYFILVRPIRLRKRLSVRQTKIPISPDYDKERVAKIDATGLIFESEGIHLYYPRSYIKDIRRLKKCLYIQAAMGFGTCIPYSAFSSQEEIDKAFALLKSENPATNAGGKPI